MTAMFLTSSVASGSTYDDPNDTAGPLDIERVAIDPNTLSVVTHGRAEKEADSISCMVRRDALDIRKKIRWFATTTWANPADGEYASDYAPDTGWYG